MGAVRRRASVAGLMALLIFVAGLLAELPRWSRHAPDGGFALSIAADCADHRSKRTSDDSRRGECHFGGLCCAAGCDQPAHADIPALRGLVPRAASSGAPAQYTAREDFLALAGWATAWSSRAPPRRARTA